jgi:hypothetical protein
LTRPNDARCEHTGASRRALTRAGDSETDSRKFLTPALNPHRDTLPSLLRNFELDPPTIDAALQKADDIGAIYFQFTDVIVADPYQDIADALKVPFYIGQSNVVGDTTTDMVAYVSGDVFVQVWIGTEDKLPRRIYAVYMNDPAQLRHVLALSDWVIDPPVAADTFTPANVAGAARIAFERPDAPSAHAMQPPPKVRNARPE